MKLINGSGFSNQYTELLSPLKSKEIIIISHVYDALTASVWPKKSDATQNGGFNFFNY